MLINVIQLILLSTILRITSTTLFRSDAYPKTVPVYKVRKDVYTKQPVVSGLVHTLPVKSTLSEFRRHLQCAVKEPNMNYNNGMITRLRMVPPTSKDYKAMCSFVEGKCSWADCIHNIANYEKGVYKTKGFHSLGPWSVAELIRVINGRVHYDWPWAVERFNMTCPTSPLMHLINATLSRISDMRDSVFFTGGADPGLKDFALHFPIVSHCTHENYVDMVAPWYNMLMKSLEDYRTARAMNSSFTEEDYIRQEKGYRPWSQKIAKAALFSSTQQHRMFLYDVARQRPDLMDSMNYYELGRKCMNPWHPLDNFTCTGLDKHTRKWPTPEEIVAYQKLPPGYALGLFNLTSDHFTPYQGGAYKYVVIPLGKQSVLSTSARIIRTMFYTGAVALLPRTSWLFHFQAQLIPWVHYVPMSFTGADIAEKIEWLRDHDDLAQQIAENGRNFARSYMRLEDFYCYTANWLDVMAELGQMTDATKVTFNPQVYPNLCKEQHPEVYAFPV